MIAIQSIHNLGKILLLATTILFCISVTRAEVAIPPLKSHVTDLTATLPIQEVTRLEQTLAAFEKKKGSQVSVLIVPSTQPETIEQYSLRVVEAWQLGRKKIDDGVLLLIAKNDKTLRIEVGYGLEGILPDATAKRIIEEIIVPHLKTGNFAQGIDAGVHAILGLIAGEALPPPSSKRGITHSDNVNIDSILFIAIAFIAVGRFLQSLLGRFAGATITGAGAGFVGWILFSSIAIAAIIALIAFVAGLFQYTSSGIYRNGRHHWSSGDYRGGDIGRGGFGGGFGGGGGGFGGGGASGRW